MALNEKLLEILACPQCKGNVRFDEKLEGLVCERCKLLFAIVNNIPIMLIEEAKKLS
jgi:hypothetical protein